MNEHEKAMNALDAATEELNAATKEIGMILCERCGETKSPSDIENVCEECEVMFPCVKCGKWHDDHTPYRDKGAERLHVSDSTTMCEECWEQLPWEEQMKHELSEEQYEKWKSGEITDDDVLIFLHVNYLTSVEQFKSLLDLLHRHPDMFPEETITAYERLAADGIRKLQEKAHGAK